ncbi:DUF4347 domain-containing protein [Thalassospira mesophila]|uniref:Dystroglycan-type cadherin-like domain-containing protein n=1 Tax=Thalassospira mesophila TaxID=1293891 RepID=A0A1Y2L4V0_9PROT|nr:DUF4347 domain-containing protein [Thalassospira mesophila]OSQ40874.1 hypothetical protein TMES_04285 [Thalassospira mesophila]
MTHLDRLKSATALVDGGFSRIQPMCLEPRFMFDAAGAATGAEAAHDAQAQAEAAAADPSGHDNSAGDGNTSDASSDNGGSDASPAASSTGDTGGSDAATVTPDAIPANNDQQIHEVALIDTTIEGYEKLAAGFSSDVTVITFQSDGSLSQIADLLSSYSQIDAVHLVSHGSIGAINLGGTVIGIDDLSGQSDALAEIGTHLTETGDILLYGCDVGSDQQGMAFVGAMASLTGADVAASNDATGATDQGGDWDLEVSSGSIETAVLLSETARNGFDALLAASETYDDKTSTGYGISTGVTTIDVGDWTYTSTVSTNFVVGEDSGYTTPTTLTTDGSGTDKVLEINGSYISQNTNPLTLTVTAKDGSTFTLSSFDFGIFGSTDPNREATITVYNGATPLGTFAFQLATGSSGDGISYVANTDVDPNYSTGHFSFDSKYANATSFSIAMTGPGTFQMDNLVANSVAANSAPTVAGVPADVSVTEDVASNFDLSAITFADADGDNLTVTIAASAGKFAATSSGSVTVGGSGTGSLTLTGSAANINTWLDTTSNIQYTGASDASGDNAATFTVHANDGTTNPQVGGGNIDITAVNDDPTSESSTDSNETGFPLDLTFAEYTQAPLDLTSINLVDVDSGSGDLTLVLTASSGTFSLASSSGALDLSGNGTGTITLVGTLADLEAYIDQPTNINYKGAANVNGTGEKITVTLKDGGNTGTGGGSTVTLGDINLSITAIDDAPEASAPTDVTVFTDTLSNLDLSALDFADVDSTALTVTLTLNAGTFSTGTFSSPADGGGVGSGVTATLLNATTITLAGSITDINAYLGTSSNIKYTTASGAQGDNVATITVKANDGTTDATVATINIDAEDPNDAPVLTPASPSLTGITEDATTNSGQTVGSFLTGVTDADTGAVTGIAISGLASGNGSWQYSTDGGSNWTNVGAVSETSALLLRSTDKVRFVPNGENATTASISYHAWDQTGSGSAGSKVSVTSTGADTAFSTATDTASIAVSSLNDAPTVTNGSTVTLTGTDEGTTSSGTAVSTVLTGAGYGDVDTGASSGIAITGMTGNGTWEYSTNGTTWKAVGAASSGAAVLLSSSSQVRYVPDGDNGETATLSFKAWDTTNGTASTNTTVSTADTSTSGGTSAFSSNGASASIVVSGVNDAPTVTNGATVTLTGTSEDTTSTGKAISDILTSAGYADVDTGASSGIAITGMTGNGTWEYSTDGTTWKAVGAASSGAAVLLSSSSQVRYVPDGDNSETATLSFNAWDATSGTASTNTTVSTVDTSTSGGTSAFSTGAATASIAVSSVNDAPTVTNGSTVTLTGTDEGTTSSGTAVSTVLTGAGYGDVDTGAASGIAITGMTGNGTWEYSTDGTTWKAVGAASSGAAVLLSSSSQVRYVPDGDNGETATLSFKAWDTTSGTASTNTTVSTADTSTSGGTSAFSSNGASASIVVSGVNDAPTVTDNAVVTLTGTNEDTTSSAVSISDILTSAGYADADVGASSGIAITGLTGNGTWQYSLNGTDWTTISAASPAAAVLLSSTTQVHFVPNDQNGETATLSFKAWDTTSGTASTNGVINSGDTTISGGNAAFSSEDASIKIVVSDVNDAPDLTNGATVPLTGTNEATTSSGTAVSAILTGAGYSDVDTSATSGIAITGKTGNGTWQYSTDGTSWVDITSAAGNAAVLLTSTSQVRYIPDGNNGETATLSFKAWDQATGAASTNGGVSTADATTSGGTSAFSSNTASASLTVTDVNDAPTLTNGGVVTLPTTNEDTTSSGTAVSAILTGAGYADADTGANSGIAITGLTGNGTWQYSTDGTTWVTIGPASTTSALLLNSSSQVRFVPDGKNGETASLSFKAWDQTTGVASTSGIRNTADTTTSGGTAAFSNEVASTKIVVSNVNDAPTGPGGLPGVTVENGGPLNYSLSVAGFADVDGDNLTFTATLADGSALPQWLSYSVNGTNVTFSGTVPGDFIGNIALRITATEDASAHLTATSDLTINVQPRPTVVPPAPPSAPDPAPVPPVMAPPGNGSLGDAGTPVSSAIDFGGRNNGDIAQPVTGQLGSLSPIDTSPTPVMAGFESATPPSIFGDSGGQTIFGGDVGGGTGILAARSQLITSQGSGVGGQGPANGATGNGPDGSGGNDLPSGNEDINGGGGSNAAPAGNVPAEQAPEQGEQDGSAEPSSDNSPSAASPDGAPDNSSGNENGDVPPSDAGNVQGSLMVPGMSPFDTAANTDFTDQLAGAGNAFDRHASLLSNALSHYDASAA